MTATDRATLWSAPRRVRIYSSQADAPRARRASDLVLAIGSVVGLAFFLISADPPSAFESALTDLARSVPAFLDVVWESATWIVLGWALVLLLVALWHRRWTIARDVVLATGIAGVLVRVADQVVFDGRSEFTFGSAVATHPPTQMIGLSLALVAAATLAAAPHHTRPVRTTGRWLLALGAVSVVILGATTPSGAVMGILVGVLSAALVHTALGSCAGRPSLQEVTDGLDQLKVETTALAPATRQTAGVFLVETTDPAGARLVAKVYGRDAWDTQLLSKAWRALWYRNVDALTLTRLQQAEHEAFITLLAGRNGVPVDHVVNAGRSKGNDALIVLRLEGEPMVDVLAEGSVPHALDAMWDTVMGLQAGGIVHRDLAPSRFRWNGTQALLGGFEGATVSPTGDQERVDQAQLLVTTVLLFGREEATEAALNRLGAEGLGTLLPYLQIAALGPRLRSDLQQAGLDLDELRKHAAEVAGVEAPQMAKLRRVSKSTVLQAALLSAGAYFLISALGGIDFAEVVDQLQSAIWGLLVFALFLGQTPRFAQAEATRGACPRPIAYGPVALLQFAITFVNLVLPSTAARVAVNIRFFQRQGIPAASAVSIGIIDSLGGFAVQLMILAGAVLFGHETIDADLSGRTDVGAGDVVKVVAIIAAVTVVVVAIAATVPKLRRWALDHIRPWFQQIRETVGGLQSPTKVLQIIGGNLVGTILFSLTLGVCLAAFHTSVSLGTLLVINVVVALFSGIMPVPGGIGVTEGATIAMLTAVGVDEAVAFAATICYRMVTFYLPPIWGAAAFHRMEKNGLL